MVGDMSVDNNNDHSRKLISVKNYCYSFGGIGGRCGLVPSGILLFFSGAERLLGGDFAGFFGLVGFVGFPPVGILYSFKIDTYKPYERT